jgi:3-methyladenine DNA glycosylase AlkD
MEAVGSATEAAAMQAYMKHHFKFLGIKKPIRAELEKDWIIEHKKLEYTKLEQLILELWSQPEREFHYTALELAIKAKAFQNQNSIELFRRLIQEKSWWDSVDTIASKLVGGYFRRFPENQKSIITKWNASTDMWLIRSSIIFQLAYGNAANFDFLCAMILPHTESKEFFIQKAIGWSLRQYAKKDPLAVLQFTNAVPLKPLSRREALKHLSS